MSTHKFDAVSPRDNPVVEGDHIIAGSGEQFVVKQNMRGDYWLQHIASEYDLTYPMPGQRCICRQILTLGDC